MFIVELDRPWTQTRFMLQGFLLTEKLDYEALRSLVNELVIDPHRSTSESLTHLILRDIQETPKEDISPVENDLAQKFSNAEKKTDTAALVVPNGVIAGQLMEWIKKRWNFGAKQKRHYLENQDQKTAVTVGTNSSDDEATPEVKEFSRVVTDIHPKDTSSLSLNWLERWQNWCDQRHKRKIFTRGENIRKVSPALKKTNYLGQDVTLVTIRG